MQRYRDKSSGTDEGTNSTGTGSGTDEGTNSTGTGSGTDEGTNSTGTGKILFLKKGIYTLDDFIL